jgi:hypothetical protein
LSSLLSSALSPFQSLVFLPFSSPRSPPCVLCFL